VCFCATCAICPAATLIRTRSLNVVTFLFELAHVGPKRHAAHMFSPKSLLPSLLLFACHVSPAVESPAAPDVKARGSIEIPPDPPAPPAPRPEVPVAAPSADTNGLDRCEQPFVAGSCKALMPVYFHNAATGRCEPRNYGGCGGNDNRFPDESACQAACGCPEGRVRMQTCEKCGMAGGCDKPVVGCVKRCSASADCAGEPGPVCLEGKCVTPCR